MNLQAKIETILTKAAAEIAGTIQTSSITELLDDSKPNGATRLRASRRAHVRARNNPPSTRLARRSSKDLDKLAKRIASLVAKKPNGMSAEEIKDAIGLSRKELPRPIRWGLDKKFFKSKGEKRATRYFATKAVRGKPTKKAKRVVKKASAKKPAKKAPAKRTATAARKSNSVTHSVTLRTASDEEE